ncbi:unnamed protein product [Dibothriocephalus latus]|uniref:Uncharacterized protein n=1 Tax=Dibothriocephalus latus TaxID=60516 RepID=A0A3P7P2R3_DIBLA|nr:unnamed protein product [Dibothriocephalus latus]
MIEFKLDPSWVVAFFGISGDPHFGLASSSPLLIVIISILSYYCYSFPFAFIFSRLTFVCFFLARQLNMINPYIAILCKERKPGIGNSHMVD